MEKQLEKIREDYKKIQTVVNQKQAVKVSLDVINANQKDLSAFARRVNGEQDEQLTFYAQQYQILKVLATDAKTNNVSKAQYQQAVERAVKNAPVPKSTMLRENQGIPPLHLQHSSPPAPSLGPSQKTPQKNQFQIVADFFQAKQSGIRTNRFESELIQPKNSQFKIKEPKEPTVALTELNQQNQSLRVQLERNEKQYKEKLERIAYEKQKMLDNQLESAHERISRLENELSVLHKENQQLKERSTQILQYKQTQEEIGEHIITELYSITPLSNDLKKINTRNIQNSGRSSRVGHTAMDEFGAASSSKMNQVCIDSQSDRSKVSGIGKTAIKVKPEQTRECEKTAFLSSEKCIIFQDEHIKLEAIQSKLNISQDEVKVELILTSKLNKELKVQFRYDFDLSNYSLSQSGQILELEPLGTIKEIIRVQLLRNIDLSSTINCELIMGSNFFFAFYLPVCFLKFSHIREGTKGSFGQLEKLTFTPSPQFAQFQSMSQLLPLTKKDLSRDQGGGVIETAAIWAKSKYEEGPIYLTWKPKKNLLKLQTSPKWVSFLAFLMHKPASLS